jgi:putative flippase GtrA
MKKTKDSYAPLGEENKQVGKFGITGIINTLIDFGGFNLAFGVFGWAAIPAHLLSTTLAMMFSFIANKTYVFASRSRQVLVQAALFVLVTAAGLYLIQTGVLSFLLFVWEAPLALAYTGVTAIGLDGLLSQDFVINNGGKVVATVFSMVWNYLLYRNVVFNDKRSHIFDVIGDWFADYRHYLLLAGVLVLAAVFRLWQLDTLPPGLHPGEATDGRIAASVAGGNLGALNQATSLVGAPYVLLQTTSVLMLGKTVLALRIVPAVLGILAVLLTYLAAQAWFSRRTAFVAAFLMASAPWAVHVSRLSDYASLVPVLVPLAMWAVARALRSNKALWYVAAGLTLGGLSYGGVPYYTWIVLLLALGVFARRYYRDRMKYSGQPILIVLLSMAIAGAPRIIFGVLGGGAEQLREVGEAMVLAAQTAILTGWQLLLNGMAGLGLFHIRGDQSALYNLPGMPLLGGVVGVLFLLGVLLALRRFRDIRYGALVIMLTSLFLVNLFETSQPAAARNVAILPIACILAAVGLIELFARWRGVFPRNVLALQLAVGVILAALGVSTFYNWQHYFVAWANTPEVFTAYHERHVQAGRYVRERELPAGTAVVVGQRGKPIFRYLTRNNYRLVSPDASQRAATNSDAPIIVARDETTGQVRFPGYQAEHVYSQKRPDTILFTVYTP